MSKGGLVFTAILAVFSLFFTPALSQQPERDIFTSVPEQDWRNTFSLTNERHDPLSQKIALWLSVTETTIPADVKDLMRFALQNSDWPKLRAFRDRVERGIPSAGLQPAEIASWFDQNPPRSPAGIGTYIQALADLEQEGKAKAALQKFWLDASLDKKETADSARLYGRLFPATAHAERLEALLWAQRYTEAEYMFPLVDKKSQKLAKARIALGRLSSKATKLIQEVPQELQNDKGLLYDRLRWRRQMNKDNDAFELLQGAPKNHAHPEMWWKERNILARRAMEDGNHARAYKIALNHGLATGVDYAQAEWMLGWLALEFLKQPDRAYQHFDRFYQAVNSAVSRSRAAWWLARASEKMRQTQNAKNWHMLGAQFPSTFYGQLSYEKIYGPINPAQFLDDQATPEAEAAFRQKEVVRVIRLLTKRGLSRFTDAFFIKLLDDAKTRADYIQIARLAREASRPYFIIESNKQMQQKLGEFMYTMGYPFLPPLQVSAPEKALIHAIVHRESMFNIDAVSPAGARGAMQLMPATARQVSKSLGKRYTVGKLTENPHYNIELGAAYLQSLLEQYDGFYPLAIAAYNAGPGNVNKWIRAFGDPREGKVDIINWIEQIPIYETRNYIQRVMESYYIYKLRLSEPPKTVLAFSK